MSRPAYQVIACKVLYTTVHVYDVTTEQLGVTVMDATLSRGAY